MVMAWVLLFLSYEHIQTEFFPSKFGSGYDLNVRTYTMLLVCKLSSLGFCYKDGGEDQSKLTPDQKARMVVELPTPLEVLSYTFFCQTCALGVFFEFSDYKRFIERTHEYKNVPSPILPSLSWLATSCACLGVFIVGDMYYPLADCWNEKFLELMFPSRIVYYFVALTFKRYFYYSPFCMTTGAVVASGLGYNGVKTTAEDKQVDQWDKIVSVYIWEIETMVTPIEGMRCWNHQVHLWLKHYVLARLTAPGKRPGAFENMTTFIVSAFWHGFRPFFYIMFFFAAILVEISKDLYKAGAVFSFIPKPVRYLLSNFLTMLVMNYFGVLHNAKEWGKGSVFCAGTYYFVFIGLIVTLTATRSLGLVKYAQKLESGKKGSEVTAKVAASADKRVDEPKKDK